MPGYGFAFAKPGRKDSWKELVSEYLTTRKVLKRVLVLIDSRHGIKISDEQMLQLLEETKVTYQIVLTKTDEVDQDDLARRYYLIQKQLSKFPKAMSRLIMVSCHTLAGISELRKELAGIH